MMHYLYDVDGELCPKKFSCINCTSEIIYETCWKHKPVRANLDSNSEGEVGVTCLDNNDNRRTDVESDKERKASTFLFRD